MTWFNNLKLSRKVIGLVIFESVFLFLIGFVGYHYSQATLRFTEEILTLALIFMAIVLSTVLGLFIVHIIIDPIHIMIEKMKEVAKGNLFVEPVKVIGQDEFGELSIAFNAMTDKLQNQIRREQLVKDKEIFLKKIIVASITSLHIKDTIRTIVTETGEFFKADRCYYVEYDEKDQEHLPIKDYAVYLSSLYVKDIVGYKFTKEQMKPVIRYAFGQRRVLALSNANDIEVPEETRNLFQTLGVKSFLAAPVFFREEVIGRIGMHFVNDYKKFTQDDIDLISDITSQSAIVIHQAKLYCQIEEWRNRESLLRTIISNTLLSTSREEAIKNITTEIGKLFNADRTCFMLFDNILQTFSEIKGEYKRKEDMPSAEGKIPLQIQKDIEQFLIEELFNKKKILVFHENDDIKCPKRFKDFIKNLGIKTAVVAPVFYADKPIGAILITNTESTKLWSKEELDLLVPIIQQISIGMNIFQLNEKLNDTVKRERCVKDIALKARELDDYKQVWDYLLDKLTDIFGVDRALNLRFIPDGNLCIRNEVIKNIDQAYSLGQNISNVKNTLQILPDEPNKMIIINNIDTDIENHVLKEYFRSKRTFSLLLYPVSLPYLKREQIEAIIMLCSSVPRKWTSEEIESFKLIIDTVTLVYLELKQKQEADEQRKTFLATLTHDLRSPLLGEQKALEAILSKKMGISLENYSEYLEDMYRTNDELLRIVNNLLMTYCYEEGKTELTLEPSNINDIVCNVVKSMKSLAQDNDSKIVTDIPPSLPLVMANADEINRVITNLVSNAIKHNTKGTNIKIIAKTVNNEVQVLVQDNGKGIPESERPKIFQKYPTTKRKIGSGLGLYLSKQIIDAHKGTIWFETEEGKGTTFSFLLPIS